jgi:hypothetical protein
MGVARALAFLNTQESTAVHVCSMAATVARVVSGVPFGSPLVLCSPLCWVPPPCVGWVHQAQLRFQKRPRFYTSATDCGDGGNGDL